MTRSTDELKERLKKSCGWCGRYPPCSAAAAASRPGAPEPPGAEPRCHGKPDGASADAERKPGGVTADPVSA